MPLTSTQLTTLKNAIAADSNVNTISNTSDGNFDIAVYFNQLASPDYFVWATSVKSADLQGQPNFDWSRVDNMTVGQARIWELMTRFGIVNPSFAAVRAGINSAFSGTVPGDVATRLAIFQASQRKATKAEKLFASGPGTTTNNTGVGPSVMTFEGNLSYQDVTVARNS